MLLLLVLPMCIAAQQLTPLNTGDQFPDIRVGTEYLSDQPTASFSMLAGKLVILDFWHSSCASCIAAFPKMAALQDHFGDRIQIFLVNVFEDHQTIAKRLPAILNRLPKDFTLPLIMGNDTLVKLFPHQAVPHHVWVAPDGKLVGAGSALNTHADKIQDVLSGREVTFLGNSNTDRPVPKDRSLGEYIPLDKAGTDGTQSFQFAGHQSIYAASGSAYHRLETTSAGTPTIRETFINYSVGDLYYNVFREEIWEQKQKMLYRGPLGYGKTTFWMDFIKLSGITDTALIFSGHIPPQNLIDRDFVRSRYSYEQEMPLYFTDEQRLQAMLNNLNGYFGDLLGFSAALDTIDTIVHVLKWNGSSKGGTSNTENNPAIRAYISRLFAREDRSNSELGAYVVIDEMPDHVLGGFSLDLSEEHAFEKVVRHLERCGINLVRETRPVRYIHFSSL